MQCSIEGCGRRAACWIYLPWAGAGVEERAVCNSCRDEMTAVYKWKYGGAL